MKSLTLMLKPIKDALCSVSDNVGHFEANDMTKSYIVYAEDTEAAGLEADNIKFAQKLNVYVDAFLKVEDIDIADSVQQKFNEYQIPFELISTTYEAGTIYHFVHYRWRTILS